MTLQFICNFVHIFEYTNMCTHVYAYFLMTSLGNYAYFDAINVKHILMTLQI